MPCIEGLPSLTNQNRFSEASLYTTFNAWASVEYGAVLFLDSDTLVVGEFTTVSTYIVPRMKPQNRSFPAAQADIECRSGTEWTYFNAGVS